MYGDQNTNMKMVEAAGMGIILHYQDITKDNILKALRAVLDNPRCNTKTFLCTYSVDLYYSNVTTTTNTVIKMLTETNVSLQGKSIVLTY
jgi:UDP:flavonoid glycosyltransferase YjiC (YdhE family)